MFADASVLVAIMVRETGWETLMAELETKIGAIRVSPLVRFETVLAVARARSGGSRPNAFTIAQTDQALSKLLTRLGAKTITLTSAVGEGAIAAAATYGKAVGHPAKLNLGDCFAYACAKSLGVPLLYKGDDFARTDLA